MESYEDKYERAGVRADSGEIEVSSSFAESLGQVDSVIEALSGAVLEMEIKIGKDRRDLTKDEIKELQIMSQTAIETAMRGQRQFGDIEEFTLQNIGDRIKKVVTETTGEFLQGNRVLPYVLDFLKINWSLPNKDLDEFVRQKKKEIAEAEESQREG